jgi:hypothetical protein
MILVILFSTATLGIGIIIGILLVKVDAGNDVYKLISKSFSGKAYISGSDDVEKMPEDEEIKIK